MIGRQIVASAAKALMSKRDSIVFETLSRLLGRPITDEDLPDLVGSGRLQVLPYANGVREVVLDGETVLRFFPERFEDEAMRFDYQQLR